MEKDDLSYSLVMTAFIGRYGRFEAAAEKAFGRSGMATFTLAFDREQRHLPAEIADGLTRGEAEGIAQALQEAGAQVYVVPTAKVDGVKHRAVEVWPAKEARGFHFTEVDGMILTLLPLNARDNVRWSQERNPEAAPWQRERGINHQHPSHEWSREALRTAREFGDELVAALREAYPDRGFVLDYLCEQVSFYQRGDDAPEENEPSEEPLPETAYCDICKQQHPYRLRMEPDPEFPLADWGECVVCGAEILLRTWEVRVVVGPEQRETQ